MQSIMDTLVHQVMKKNEMKLLLLVGVKKKKRKMGMYNLVPKKKTRALRQQEKAGPRVCLLPVGEAPAAGGLTVRGDP